MALRVVKLNASALASLGCKDWKPENQQRHTADELPSSIRQHLHMKGYNLKLPIQVTVSSVDKGACVFTQSLRD